MKNIGILIGAVFLIVIGVLGLALWQYFLPPVKVSDVEKSFSTLGEQIYITGRGENGRFIPFIYGPGWLRMRGGGCASCHGVDGRGGIPIMMSNKIAPDIRWKVLAEEEHKEPGEEHPPYDEKLVKRAITEGLDPAGEPLSYVMPRWQMNTKELNAIVDFLKELD